MKYCVDSQTGTGANFFCQPARQLPNPIICIDSTIEVVGILTGPLKMSIGPTENVPPIGLWASGSFHPHPITTVAHVMAVRKPYY